MICKTQAFQSAQMAKLSAGNFFKICLLSAAGGGLGMIQAGGTDG